MAGFMGHLQQLTSAKMLSLPVLLFFLICGNAMLVNAKPLRQHQKELWHRYLGSTEMPEFLHVRMSAMEIDEKHDFRRLTKEKKLSSFCDSAYLVCKLKDDQSNGSYATSFRSEASPEKEQFLFRKSEILVGQKIIFEELESPVPFRRFLPKKLAGELPFGTKSLPKLLEMLSIPPDSHMAQTMEESMAICEEGKRDDQPQTCAKSLDGLVKFVAQNVGRNLQIFQPTVTDTVKGQDMTITDIALRGRLKPHKAVVCRDMNLPSLVFDCLVVEKVQIVEVKLVSEEDVEYKGLMKCNRREKEKRKLSMRKELGKVHEDMKRCSWLSANELVFVKKEEKESKEEEEGWESEEAMENGEDEEEEGIGKKMKKIWKRMEDFTHHGDEKDEKEEDGEEGTSKKLKHNITHEDDSFGYAKNLKNNRSHEDDGDDEEEGMGKKMKKIMKSMENITHDDDVDEKDEKEEIGKEGTSKKLSDITRYDENFEHDDEEHTP